MGHYDDIREEQDRIAAKERFAREARARIYLSFKALREGAIIPTSGTEFSAGFDLSYCPKEGSHPLLIPPNTILAIPTGIAMSLPRGYHAQVWGRSGNVTKRGLTTEAGIIDEDYRGEIHAICANRSFEGILIEPGERVAQMVIVSNYPSSWMNSVYVCGPDEELPPCGTRGANGFGSTGQ